MVARALEIIKAFLSPILSSLFLLFHQYSILLQILDTVTINMAEKTDTIQSEAVEQPRHRPQHLYDRSLETAAPMEVVAELQQARHINLTWKSWVVVFISCWAIMAQVYVVVAAGSVIAFIIRDLGDASIAGWIIQVTRSESPVYVFDSLADAAISKGATSYAKRAVTVGRQAVRRPRSKVYGQHTTTDRFRWSSHISESELHGHAYWWRYSHWRHPFHNLHCPSNPL